ncbi:MAG: bifunctional 2-polyprenyl-6-hydroxyphenol methylase/3-demethylubiquinol 3-O-methyltransferase UbiG [Rhodospirillales bacterium]|nr:bifunctional 2-polyprenyl-6-hydroxyphenol methylase/3-demethylubiquinol 3-O-methyltransferase UbiG [Rhodospirillales bacterium]
MAGNGREQEPPEASKGAEAPRAAAAEPATNPSVDPAEIERFAALAERWWDRHGAFRALHALNPVRIAYVRDALVADAPACARADAAAALKPLAGLRLLDVGCGGGLMAEPLCRLGAHVVAIDAAEANVRAARHHAEEQGLAIDYRHATAEALAADGERFDAVLALEIVEHVADLDVFAEACASLVKPGGTFVVATLNRTLAAYALAVVAAERILGWLPAGSHDWSRFVRPAEMVRLLRRHGLGVADMRGMVYNPLAGGWTTSPNLAVNYIVHARKPGD